MASHEGIVLRAHSGQYAVLDAEGVIECRARRHLRRPQPDWPEFPVPGDQVDWRLLSGEGARRLGIVEAVHPRRTEISRTRFGRKHVVVANLDRLVVVVAVREPALDRGLLDRLLVIAERNRIAALVCLHKIDRVDPSTMQPVQAVYENAGYEVVMTSAETGTGVDSLRERLRGHTSAFVGASGAGKSRLIGALQPGLMLRTGPVSEKTGQGRHTTTRVDLHRTEFGALLADTPGVRDFSLWRLAAEELTGLFPDLEPFAAGCKFGAGCTHAHEPSCNVREAAETGQFDGGRYRSFRALHVELCEAATDQARRPSLSERRRHRGGREPHDAPERMR